MTIKGIDVSTWQGSIDFNRVKQSGINFVIIRAGYGSALSQKDKWYETNYARAKAAGLHVGAYWYSYAGSAGEAREEARVCKQVLSGKQFDYPIYFDLEEKSQLARGRVFCDSLIRAFCNEMEAGGYFAGFYTSLSAALNYVSPDVRNRYAFWVAQWNSRCTYGGQYGLWQYSSSGSVPGIAGRCDMDLAYVDYPSIIRKGGFNGYGKGTSSAPARKSVNTLAHEVIAGAWGNGEVRVNRLTKAGYDYDAVQARVNELLGIKPKKSIDTLAREGIRGDWGNGTDRKNHLTKAGYNYDSVQKRVNELLGTKPQTKSIDTIAREVIRGDWGNGADRKNRLAKAGYDYNAVQKRVNELLK